MVLVLETELEPSCERARPEEAFREALAIRKKSFRTAGKNRWMTGYKLLVCVETTSLGLVELIGIEPMTS